MTIGRLVTPTLKLVREIGEGGMGKVWAAENLALGSLVAVKMMARGYIDDDKSIVRFKQEAQRAARVRNPHVATIFDHGMTPEGEPYIVMELLEGENLRERIERYGALPLDEVKTLIGQTAKALTAAHKLGVVHRDIKPANLFVVDNEGEPFVKVVDFGIAKQMDFAPRFRTMMTTTNSIVGSPAYMSPEQFMNPKEVDWRADLWSLAVVAYEAVTGVPPFAGETAIALAMAITRGRFKLPSEIRIDLPSTLDEWMKVALDLNPDKRFQSAMEMSEALRKNSVAQEAPLKKISVIPPNGPSSVATTVRTPRQEKPPSEDEDKTRIENAAPPRIGQPPPSILAYARFFEGAWIGSPSGGHYYVRFVRGQLRVAYCYSGNRQLEGEYYHCMIVKHSLFARFRWRRVRGYIAMHEGSDDELIGGWWSESAVPANIATDLSKLSKAVPGMRASTWRRVRPTPTFPDWAEAYFASIASSEK